jgi:transcriptional regulator with XRE-family HTH domain
MPTTKEAQLCNPFLDIGARLRSARERQQMTVEQCATAVGIEPAEWLDMESRDYSKRSAMLGGTVALKAAEQLDVDPYWLIFGKLLAAA